MNNSYYYFGALILTYTTGLDDTKCIVIYNANDIDTVFDDIPSTDIKTLSIFQTTIDINDFRLRGRELNTILFIGNKFHNLMISLLDLRRFINTTMIHIGIICPIGTILLPEGGNLDILVFINMDLTDNTIPNVSLPSSLSYVVLENTDFNDPFRFRQPNHHCSLIVTLHLSTLIGCTINSLNPPYGVHVLNSLDNMNGKAEYSYNTITDPATDTEDPRDIFNGWIGWWGEEIGNVRNQKMNAVPNMSSYSQQCLDEVLFL
jgi:hypothetical protein